MRKPVLISLLIVSVLVTCLICLASVVIDENSFGSRESIQSAAEYFRYWIENDHVYASGYRYEPGVFNEFLGTDMYFVGETLYNDENFNYYDSPQNIALQRAKELFGTGPALRAIYLARRQTILDVMNENKLGPHAAEYLRLFRNTISNEMGSGTTRELLQSSAALDSLYNLYNTDWDNRENYTKEIDMYEAQMMQICMENEINLSDFEIAQKYPELMPDLIWCVDDLMEHIAN